MKTKTIIEKNPKYLKARQYFTAQQYIEAEYPKLIQKSLKKLDISNLDLKGELDLRNFPKLEELNCANNLLTRLDLSNCVNLKKLNGDGNNGLKVLWNETISNQVRYSILGVKKPVSAEEIRQTKIKKQRRKGCVISESTIWNNLHADFDFETSQAWRNLGFNLQQARDWINAGFKPQDLKLCVWLRDIKQIEADWVINYASERELRAEFEDWKQGELINQIENQLKIK